MKTPIYLRTFSYNLELLLNPQLAAMEHGVITIEQIRQKSGETFSRFGSSTRCCDRGKPWSVPIIPKDLQGSNQSINFLEGHK